jgi:hypothetical protein
MPATVARYRIVSQLGSGGMGEVYLAEDPTLDRRVAIKVLPAPSASDETARLRLVREAQAAAKMFVAQNRSAEARAIARRLEEMSPPGPALQHLSARILLVLGDTAGAFDRLERALEASGLPIFYKDSALWDPVRTDERFIGLLKRMRIPEGPVTSAR